MSQEFEVPVTGPFPSQSHRVGNLKPAFSSESTYWNPLNELEFRIKVIYVSPLLLKME